MDVTDWGKGPPPPIDQPAPPPLAERDARIDEAMRKLARYNLREWLRSYPEVREQLIKLSPELTALQKRVTALEHITMRAP